MGNGWVALGFLIGGLFFLGLAIFSTYTSVRQMTAFETSPGVIT